jgi:hypothetical protein
VTWPKYTADGSNIIDLNIPVKPIQGQFLQERCEFWDELFPEYVNGAMLFVNREGLGSKNTYFIIYLFVSPKTRPIF